jgi:two-component system phosphate regulon response regulator OmpR
LQAEFSTVVFETTGYMRAAMACDRNGAQSAMASDRKTQLLLVDDDLRLRTLLETYLQREDFEVRGAGNAQQMHRALKDWPVDLMVLDLSLPGASGLDICRELRAQGNELPIVMLTAKGDDIDRILGLELGADDYLPKPCNPRELVARIRAVLRRRVQSVPGAPTAEAGAISFGRFRLQTRTRVLESDREPITLTTAEFALLHALLTHPGETLSRAQLLKLARGRGHEAFDRSVDVQVSRLRRLIEVDPSAPRYLQTVWGAGYVFVPDDS